MRPTRRSGRSARALPPRCRARASSSSGERPRATWGPGSWSPSTRTAGKLRGLAVEEGKPHELRPLETAPGQTAGPRQHLVAPSDYFRDKPETPDQWRCDQDGAPLEFLEERAQAAATEPIFAAAITSLHTASVAIDTDNELLQNKFANNTTTATNFIASLFASMNVIYERDLLIRLVQGNTFLRVSTTPDPYTVTGTDTFAKLQEFRNYWSTNHASINRAVAAMLSGRGGSGASGIAWIDALCSKSTGYSYNQLFLSGTTPSFGEIMVTAHEIGHNFGSPHTHCYNPPVDTCYGSEGAGCHSGAASCPAATTINGVTNVRGTLMSYCHLLGGCNLSLVFHPATVNLLNPKIQSRVNTCIFPSGAAPPPTVVAVLPNSGTTAGGRPVTITGTNFRAGATVSFGGTAATSVAVLSPTTITALTPARSTGAVGVTVTNTDGTSATKSNAYFYAPPSAGLRFYTLNPCRMLDTRNANGPLGGPVLSAGQQRIFTAAGVCGVPAAAKALSVNVTVVTPSAAGLLSLYPGNAFPLGTSSINFRPGQTRANNATLTLSTNGTGTFGVQNSAAGTTHFILDINGYYQ